MGGTGATGVAAGAAARPEVDLREPDGSLQQRILVAARTCVARWGVAKTAIDDIGREAGCSRATVYRAFPGGKDSVLEALVAAEVDAFIGEISAELDRAETLEDLLVGAVVTTCRALRGHDALNFLIAHEPGLVLPHLCFGGLDRILETAAAVGGPYLERHVHPDDAAAAAEWVARMVLSHALAPSSVVDLCNADDARRLVAGFLLPGLARAVTARAN